ncbi:MAG: T9SS type A sorting domain-containing protein [Flavobacteriales bacterium]|nr:T9SS type A sorting domain-containing protein [Flavobacteriales bacterium]
MSISGDDQNDMVIFPNPNNGRTMRFSFGGSVNATNATIEFMAMNGSIVVHRAVRLEYGATSFTLDLDGDLSNGIYLARVRMGERTHIQRVVVQE